ncbi:hypothetical protein OAR08_00870 [Flavobacteriaceae bacterium]|nr:hypothetical protein [Flavobacteriaceae bacterium]
MAKSTIKLDDNFVFKFPKKKQDPTTTEESYYPKCLFEHLLSNEDRIDIAHEGITSKFIDWKYKFNSITDPFYILEISLSFCSKDENELGGYRWEFSVSEENKLVFSDIKILEEDENLIYFSVKVKGEITWDFKPNHLDKIKQKMKSFCPWDEVALDINMNLRSNFLHPRYFPEYKKGEEIPETEQTSDNLPFVLDKIPNSFATIHHREPKRNWELSEKHWMKLSDKNITFEGKYLSPYNS